MPGPPTTSSRGTGGGGHGTVTSVGLVLPTEFTVTVSPITTSGDLTAVWKTETAHTVFAGPASGSPAIPTFRALVKADLPLPLDHHADLTNFTANDDHTQYVKLAGRPSILNDLTINTDAVGGIGTIYGNANSGGHLRLVGNPANDTTSVIEILGDSILLNGTAGGAANVSFFGGPATGFALQASGLGPPGFQTYVWPPVPPTVTGQALVATTGGVMSWAAPAAAHHDLFSATHSDTIPGTPITSGAYIQWRSSPPAWKFFEPPGQGQILYYDQAVAEIWQPLPVDPLVGQLLAWADDGFSNAIPTPITPNSTDLQITVVSVPLGLSLELTTTGVTAGSHGSATQSPTYTVDAKGRLTAAANVTITPAASSITGGAALTRTNDTNVTLTLGGSPTTALLAASSLTLGWTGTLAAARLNANVVQAVTNDTNVTGSIATQTLTLGWTGSLAIARGGHGSTTALGGFNALSPLTTRGDLLTRDATNNIRLAIGAAAKYLRSDGTDPSWQTIAYADISGTPTGLPPTGTAGGDLSGTYPNPTVAKINGVAYNADPLVQYTKLAGRTGSTNNTILSTDADGTLSGSAASGGNMIWQSTTHATKGGITAQDALTETESRTGHSAFDWTGSLSLTGLGSFRVYHMGGAITLGTGQSHIYRGVLDETQFTTTASPVSLAGILTIESIGSITLQTNGITGQGYTFAQNEEQIKGDSGAGNTVTQDTVVTLQDNSGLNVVTGNLITTSWTGINIVGSMKGDGTANTVTTRTGIKISQPSTSGASTKTITTNLGIDIDDMTISGTTKISIRSSGAAIPSLHSGPVRIGDQTTPTEKLEVLGNAIVTGHQTLESGLTTLGAATEIGLSIAPTFSLTNASALFEGIALGGTWTISGADLTLNLRSLLSAPTIARTASSGLNSLPSLTSVLHAPVYTTSVASSIVLTDRGLHHTPQLSVTGSGSYQLSSVTAVESQPTVDSTITLANRYGMRHRAISGSGTVTADVAMQSEIVSNTTATTTTNFVVKDTGGAPSLFIGSVMRLYSPTSQTVPTENFVVHAGALKLTGSQAFTLVGTSLLVLIGN